MSAEDRCPTCHQVTAQPRTEWFTREDVQEQFGFDPLLYTEPGNSDYIRSAIVVTGEVTARLFYGGDVRSHPRARKPS